MIVSILLTLVVSTSFAIIGYFTGGDIYMWFFISFICQFVLFFIINTLTKTVVQLRLNALEVQRLNVLDENRIRIECSVCKDPNDVVIKVAEDNDFRCEKCKSLNTVKVSISNFQKTEIFDGVITEDLVNQLKTVKNG